MNLEEEVRLVAQAAKDASVALARKSAEARDAALAAMAEALRSNADSILSANERDMQAARERKTKESLLDRLLLDEARVEAMACALEDLISLRDPLGIVQESRTLESGIKLERVSVPLGVVAVIYEARPNVTVDAAGICLKSGNAVVLRAGSLAARSCSCIVDVLHEAAVGAGMPQGCIDIVDSTDHAAADALMSLHGVIDVLVPRGGAGLIKHCVECAKVPVIETGTGNCHVYVHETADLDCARQIIVNAKTRRYGVCNAAETLLVDASVADAFLPDTFAELADAGVRLHCDAQACKAALVAGEKRSPLDKALQVDRADESDWETEYLAPDLAVRCVSGVGEAIAHINRYGTRHSEAIVADVNDAAGAAAAQRFVDEVDAAAVYINASTAFTDGGMFGLGAEIGISTQKLHVRGPFALEGLTSCKYVLRGTGQVRP